VGLLPDRPCGRDRGGSHRQVFRIVKQYERGVVYRLGRIVGPERQPGLNFVIPLIDRMVKVSVATEPLELAPQEVITQDNVSLTIAAVIYYRVVDAIKSEVEVDGYEDAIELHAQSVLRQVIGGSDLAEVLAHSQTVAGKISSELIKLAAEWGLKVLKVELCDVTLPKGMKRAMAAQAEAAREAAAKVTAAEGELNAAAHLRAAADQLSPTALRLRELQTIRDIGAEQNTVIVVDSRNGDVAAQATAGQIAGREA
jgi:regulator of protease activity HflC (stomatin/prohibitin superfamily)